MNPVALIRKKRDGLSLTQEEITFFIERAVSKEIPDYQVTAFLMAIFFQGMSLDETSYLTQAMIRSGEQICFKDNPSGKPKIDKHSTGGVGDKVSLILAPLVASLGVDVPMVAGRGLGHTGGTLDKLESIDGFNVRLEIEEFKRIVSTVGTAIMGQTERFVPADKLLYSLRDVTGTVECIPLMTASILSKKAAEGISGLVIDLKVGTGAFMKTLKEAERLAKVMVSVGKKLGLKIRVLITDMNQPLGQAVGHSLEVLECIDVMKGRGPQDLRDLTIELAAHMLILGGKASSLAAARKMARTALQDGSALKKFEAQALAQGAKKNPVREPHSLPLSKHQLEVRAPKAGRISKFLTEEIGMLLIQLGGGRKKVEDRIDYGVGYIFHFKQGEEVRKNDTLVTVYYNPERLKKEGLTLAQVESQLRSSILITQQRITAPKLIKKVMD